MVLRPMVAARGYRLQIRTARLMEIKTGMAEFSRESGLKENSLSENALIEKAGRIIALRRIKGFIFIMPGL
jgi:hypothetical protein